jgi:hypothetical protein
MSQENKQNTGKNEQSSGEAASAPSASEEMMLVRRPRPGSVVILAPLGMVMLWTGSEDGLKLELRDRSRE